MPKVTITCLQTTSEINVETNANLLDVLRSQNIPVNAPCGGKGRCRKCTVQLTVNGQTRTVVSCVTPVTEDCFVTVGTAGNGYAGPDGPGGSSVYGQHIRHDETDGCDHHNEHDETSARDHHNKHDETSACNHHDRHGSTDGHGHHGEYDGAVDCGRHEGHGRGGRHAYHGGHSRPDGHVHHGKHGIQDADTEHRMHAGHGRSDHAAYDDCRHPHDRADSCRHPGPDDRTGTPVPQEMRQGYGAAVDLGTTTVALELYDLSSARPYPVGVKTAWNAQRSYGSDVITRVQYIMTHTDGLNRLSSLIRGQIFSLIRELCEDHEIPVDEVRVIMLAGNTIMQHIFAGIDPSSIAQAPYTPRTLFLDEIPQHFPELPSVDVTFSPCVAGYIGGDITSGLLACGLMHHPGCALFLDIGTNGEMALCEDGHFLCCSVASGPAFEGAEITCGMPAEPGAIRMVSRKAGKIAIETIGGATAVGICGSGLIDLLSVLLDAGVIDETGRLLPPDEAPDGWLSYLSEDENGNGLFHLTHTVSLTAEDVRKLQLARAAVAAGVEFLLQEAAKTTAQIDVLYLAGGFGTCLNPQNAAAIGMFPRELAAKVRAIGNSSLSGMRRCLRKPHLRAELTEIQSRCRYLELSGNADFNDLFLDHLSFEADDE